MKSFLLGLGLLVLSFSGFHLKAQNASSSFSVYGASRFFGYDTKNFTLDYADESGITDYFYTAVKLSNPPIGMGLGIGFEHQTENHWAYGLKLEFLYSKPYWLTGAIEVGYTIGSGKVRLRPAIGAFINTSWFNLGKLTPTDSWGNVVTTVKGVNFDIQHDITVSIRSAQLGINPLLNLDFDLSEHLSLRLAGGYALGFYIFNEAEFTGSEYGSTSLNKVSSGVDLKDRNISFKVEGVKTQKVPYNINGVTANVGIVYRF